MKKILFFCFYVAVFTAIQSNAQNETPNIIQDIEIYTVSNTYYARGKINQQILYQSPNAQKTLQFAINQLKNVGGKVTIHRGEYEIDQQIVLENQVQLQGSGRSSRIIISKDFKDSVAILCKDKLGVTISDICVSSKNNNNMKSGIVIDGSGECKIKDCFVIGFHEYGIVLANRSFFCQISDCSLAGNNKANIFLDRLTKGGKYGNFIPNLIQGCMIYGGGYGIEANNAIVAHIIGCMIVQTKGAGIYLHDISNSILVSGTRTFQIEGHGIVVEDTDELNLTGNIFSWHTKNGIVITNSRWGTICGNEVIDNGSYNSGTADGKTKENVEAVSDKSIPLYNGIVLKSVKGFSVSGNTIFNWPVCMPMKYGIIEDSLSFKNIISSNHVNYTKKEGIVSRGQESVSTNNTIYKTGPMRREKDPYYDKEFNSWWSQSFQTELIDMFIELQK